MKLSFRPAARSFLVSLFCLAAPLAAAATATLAASPTRPNILLIITDQHSADAMSCRMGDRWLRTPHIDSIAARGVAFTRAYTANPICMPARTAMFTGRYPHETGVQNNEKHPVDAKRFPTLGTALRNSGYATGYVGKWHIAIPIEDAAASGFDYTANLKAKGADARTPPAAAEFLQRQRGSDRPWFLVTSFINPHNICEWPRGQELPDGEIGAPPPLDELPPAPANLAAPRDEPDATALARRAYHANNQFPVGNYTADKWRQYRWAYYRMIEKVDAEIGRVLAALRDSGHADNTLIVLTSDHGDCQGAHGWNQKTVFYEESTRIPFIVAPPRAKRRGTSDRLVNVGIDLFPTLADFAGIEPPAKLPGLSRRAAAESDTGADSRRYIVVSNHLVQGMPILGVKPMPAGRMLRSARYKYCVYDQGERRESLVDLQTDPGELANLAYDPAARAILDDHRRMLQEWSRTTADTTFPFIAPQ